MDVSDGNSDTTKDPSSDDDKSGKGKKKAVVRASSNTPRLSMVIRITRTMGGSASTLIAGQILWLIPMPGLKTSVAMVMESCIQWRKAF